ncbi:hypothetical protein ACOSP7_031318 [Xanthoceras sorbifolium]
MSSPIDQKRHKAGTVGPSNKGDRKSRPFDDVLLEYKKFASGERTGHQGDKVVVAYQRDVTGSSTSSRTKVRSDRRESAERDDSSLVASGRLETETGSSSFPSSVITRENLVELVHTFHLPRGA